MAKYDFVLKNGEVFNSDKKEFQTADLGIHEDRIKKIGKIDGTDAKNIIDASGKYVCPGFIDLTNHSDTFWTIFSNPYQESLISQGITTVLGGNCGSSLAPLANPKNIEVIQKWTDMSGLNINWQSMEEFLKDLENHSFGVNFATLTGHSNLRRIVVGDETRKASKTEIEEMKILFGKSLDSGSFGISFNLSSAHEIESDQKEIESLCSVAAGKNGLVKHHLKDEGKNILPSISHLMDITRTVNARTQISHFKAIGKSAWEKFGEAMSFIENSIADNVKITIDVFPYERTGSNLYLFLPEWVRKNGKRDILHLIKDINERKNIIDYLKSLTLHYEKITVASALNDKDSLGRTISEISNNTGISPEEVILNLIDINELNVSIFSEAINSGHILELIKKPYSMIATNGAGYDISELRGVNIREIFSLKSPIDTENYTHPRSFGSFPRFLKEYVREKKAVDLTEAVYKISTFPARTAGFKERGELKENFYADIAVLDINNIEDKSTYENPFQFSKGIEYVFVNGEPAFQNGMFTLKRNGRVLKKQ